MPWYSALAFGSLFVCLAGFAYHAVRLIRLGRTRDYSRPMGNTAAGIFWSFTGAMNPAKKESAVLHLPTYTAGILFHSGTFVSFLIFFITLLNGIVPAGRWTIPIACFLAVTAACGMGILLKRIMSAGLRSLSRADDYLSNAFVTLFQSACAAMLLDSRLMPACLLLGAIVLLYMPAGKLRHVFYFFIARVTLGRFYGRRGVWPESRT